MPILLLYNDKFHSVNRKNKQIASSSTHYTYLSKIINIRYFFLEEFMEMK